MGVSHVHHTVLVEAFSRFQRNDEIGRGIYERRVWQWFPAAISISTGERANPAARNLVNDVSDRQVSTPFPTHRLDLR